jgi:hypothetical protein
LIRHQERQQPKAGAAFFAEPFLILFDFNAKNRMMFHELPKMQF